MSGLWSRGLGTTIERATATECPSWCTRSYGHGSTDGHVYHEAGETVVKLGPPDASAAVMACRDDFMSDQGEPYVYMCSEAAPGFDDWGVGLPPAAAAHLGQMLVESPDGAVAQLGKALVAAAAEARIEEAS